MSQRDIGQEILKGIRQIKQGKCKRYSIDVSTDIKHIRHDLALSQSDFSTLLGISVRTLQDWEQSRRHPTGAALSLLHIAKHHPKAFLQGIEFQQN